MTDYNKTTNFTSKDTLTTGDPNKTVKGSEIDDELTAIQTAVATKADAASPVFTGSVTLPNSVEIDSADNTYQYVFSPASLTADRTVTLPLLTGNDEFVFLDHTATLTNKSIDLGTNTLTGSAAEFDAALQSDTFLFASDLIDDDTFATATATNIPSAESVKAYVDSNAGGGGDALTSNGLDQFAATTSLELKGVISDETGSGSLVFATSPTLVTPALGTPSSGILTNCTGTASGLTAGNVTTNANLTGDVTSVGNAATVDPTAITGKTTATAIGTDYVLISDSSAGGALRKALVSDFASAGGDMAAATYDPAGYASQVVTETDPQTLTSKTLTSPTITTPTLTLKQSTNPTPTAEGQVEWDTDGNILVVGDGTAQRKFIAAEDISGAITMTDAGVTSLSANIDNDDIAGGAAIDATKIHNGTVTNTEFGYLANVTSDIQAQFGNTVDISGTPVANDFARFTDGNTVEGRSFSEVRSDLGLVIGTNVQAYDANLPTFPVAADQAIPFYAGTTLTNDAGGLAFDDTGSVSSFKINSNEANTFSVLTMGAESILSHSSTTSTATLNNIGSVDTTTATTIIKNSATGLKTADTDLAISAAANVEISLTRDSETPNEIIIKFWNLIPANDGDALYLLLDATNGGGDTGASDYRTGTTDSSQIVIASPVGNSTNENGVSGEIRIYTPGDASWTHVQHSATFVTSSAGSGIIDNTNSAVRLSTSAMTYAYLKFSTGNIASGKIATYYVRTS